MKPLPALGALAVAAGLVALAVPTFSESRPHDTARPAARATLDFHDVTPDDHLSVQSNLRNALTVEKIYFSDTLAYTEDTSDLFALDTSVGWGSMHVVVGDLTAREAVPDYDRDDTVVCVKQTSKSGKVFSSGDATSCPIDAGDDQVVCIDAKSASGTTYSIGDVAAGPYVGTYWGTTACPQLPTAQTVAALGPGWPR